MIELNFINIIMILFVSWLINKLASKLTIWMFEKIFPQWIKHCPECNEKYFETSNYCEFCGKELKYLKDDEESEVIVVEDDEE